MRTHGILKTVSLLVATYVLTLMPSRALAQQRPGIQPFVIPPEGCYLTEKVEPEDLYSLAKIELQALWMAQRGEQANLEVLTAKDDLPMDQMARMMTGLREELIENTCAGFILKAFSNSRNENVATTSKFLSLSYQTLQDMDNQLLGIILEGTRDWNGPSTRTRFSEWKNKRRGVLDQMTVAVNFSLSLLVDQSRKDAAGNPDHMILTKEQRDALLYDLDSKFPSLVQNKNDSRSGDFIEQAALFQSFLTGKYKPSDSQ